MGKIVSEIKTRDAQLTTLVQNCYNGIMLTGHSNGVVSMYSPNIPDPVVKILAHPTKVSAIAVDLEGNYFATSGSDCRLKIWDCRTYK